MYFCGWDGGGSKTAVCLIDTDGAPLANASFGPLNANGASPERVRGTVGDALAFMKSQPGGLDACGGLVIGMAGISNKALSEQMYTYLSEGGYTGPLSLLGDQEIALAGAIDGPGAILIAGTGSICYGKDSDGHPFRVGGYGYLIDDLGSGYAIGLSILTAVIRALDGRNPPTRLTSLVYNALSISDIPALITWVYARTTGKKEIAALSRLLLPALEEQDSAAQSIASKAARDLADLAITGLSQHHLIRAELALTGSIFEHYPLIRSTLESQVYAALPFIRICTPKRTPAEGAARLARNQASHP
ncbi:MAG: ATPase [Clostridia bacterium]|nr:ATPase [Clostridia bacterium]